MIAVLKRGTTDEQMQRLIDWLEGQKVEVHISKGTQHTILGLVGDTSKIDTELIESLDIVDSVKKVTETFKQCNKKFHPEPTIIDVNGVKIGGGNFAIIAGPCSVESREQLTDIANKVKASGAQLLRGGAFKPRTSPYDFQGLKFDGIELLEEAKTDESQLIQDIRKISGEIIEEL